ncbi:hypothetical protein AX16_004174 [Volvariella volvacea WC 439]|nr:hypothetical protein AX16_004174 [Volvariella volvacea WC 439]
MKLHLAKSNFLNTDYTLEPHGEVLYQLQPNSSLWPSSVKITKRIPDLRDAYGGVAADRFAHLARIDFHTIHQDVISMGGQDIEVSSFFRKGCFGAYGSNRIFTGPDGREYVWELGLTTSQLFLNDDSKPLVANYYTKFWTLRHKPENAYLEIMPNGEHMVDVILVTFLYIEKIRNEREEAAQRPHHY